MLNIEKGQVIGVQFSEEVLYFYTGETTKKYGNTYYVFCKCVNEDEIDFTCFWEISEKYFNDKKASGMIREINTFNEI